MKSAYERKKEPDVVRRALLDGAARLAVEQGLSSVTVQAVADVAGVTKGGLFHHFPNKQALIEGVFTDLLGQMDAAIDARLLEDNEKFGCFTRAYIEVTFADFELGSASPWAALSVSALADPKLARLWDDWLTKRMASHRQTDLAPILQIARFAIDGMWLTHMTRPEGSRSPIKTALRRHLIALTRDPVFG